MKTIARNRQTKEARIGKITLAAAEKAIFSGVDRCTGPCGCRIEPDGVCPDGWPSRLLAAGLI